MTTHESLIVVTVILEDSFTVDAEIKYEEFTRSPSNVGEICVPNSSP